MGKHILKSKIQWFFGGTFLPIKKMILTQQRFFVLNKIGPNSPNFESNFLKF